MTNSIKMLAKKREKKCNDITAEKKQYQELKIYGPFGVKTVYFCTVPSRSQAEQQKF
jgi:hypothetical protein